MSELPRLVDRTEKRLDPGQTMIYALFAPGGSVPLYVGQTSSPGRRLWLHSSRSNNAGYRNVEMWIRSLLDAGQRPEMRVLEVTIDGNAAEIKWILALRKAGLDLLNMNDGGDKILTTARKGFKWTALQAYRQMKAEALSFAAERGGFDAVCRLKTKFNQADESIRRFERLAGKATADAIINQKALERDCFRRLRDG